MSFRNSAKVVQHSCSIWEKDWQHLVARWCQCTGHSSWQHMCRAGLGQNAGKWEHMCREVAFTSWLYSQIQNPNLSTLNPGKLFPSSLLSLCFPPFTSFLSLPLLPMRHYEYPEHLLITCSACLVISLGPNGISWILALLLCIVSISGRDT